MKVAIVRYNAGNTRSVLNAVRRCGLEASVTESADELASADKVIFPGVGEASTAMAYLRERELDSAIRSLTRPVLAICLGMQLLCSVSEENRTQCLGVIPGVARRFPENGLKVPHVGWNTVHGLTSPIFEGVPEAARVYFVHSYFVEKGEHTIATSDYGDEFSSAVQFENFYGVQFHPERSGSVGASILENFLKL